jgi:hypothetical protein
LDLERGEPGEILERAALDLDPRVSEKVFARTGHAKSNRGMAATKQVTDDQRTAEARSLTERPHAGEAAGDPGLPKLTCGQIRLAEGLTMHPYRREVETNAEHAAQLGEADPSNQQLDDNQDDQGVQRGDELSG